MPRKGIFDVIETLGISSQELGNKMQYALEHPNTNVDEQKRADDQATRIWTAIRKELIDLSKKGTIKTRFVAEIECLGSGSVSVMYQKQYCKVYKRYDIGKDLDFHKVIFRLAIKAEEYNFSVYPILSKLRGKHSAWCIEFTLAKE